MHASGPALYEFAFAVSEVSETYDDEVDECPYSATSACQELGDTCACLSYIESVDTETSEKETKKKGHKPVLGAAVIGYGLLNRSDCTSTFHTHNGIIVDFCATITTIHSQLYLKYRPKEAKFFRHCQMLPAYRSFSMETGVPVEKLSES